MICIIAVEAATEVSGKMAVSPGWQIFSDAKQRQPYRIDGATILFEKGARCGNPRITRIIGFDPLETGLGILISGKQWRCGRAIYLQPVGKPALKSFLKDEFENPFPFQGG